MKKIIYSKINTILKVTNPKTISLSSFLRSERSEEVFNQNLLNFPLARNFCSTGVGEQNRSSELSRTSCPSIWGRIYLANKNPIYLRAAPWWEGGEVLEVRLVSEHRGGEDGF